MKIRNSSRITAIVLALMMIVPLISIPALAEDTEATEEVVKGLVWSEDFQDGKVSDLFNSYPFASEMAYGIGGKDSIAFKVEQKATWGSEIAVMYTDRSGAKDVTAIQYADGREWTGIADYDGSAVIVSTSEGTGITGVITTAEVAKGNVSNCTVVTDKGTYKGSKTLVIVEAVVANAIAGNCSNVYATIAREAFLKNPEVAVTDEKVFVLEADYYVSADFSATIEGRIYGDAGQIDLFKIAPSGDNVKVIRHNDAVNVNNGDVGVTVAKGTWINLKFVLDTTKGYPTIYCFVNGAYAFTADESTNLKDKTLTKLNANKWNLGHTSRGVDASTLTGYWAVDNAKIYNSTAGLDLPLWSSDVDSASEVGDIFNAYVPGGRIAIDSTTFADTEHGDVIAWDNTPYADGRYWLYTGSGHFAASNNKQITDITVTDGKATGSVKVGDATYYFKDATVCTTSRTQIQATMYTDADCTQVASVTYYICNGAVADAYTSGLGGNIATPSTISKGLTGNKFTISADYNFGTDLACKGMDIRLHSPNVHFFSVGSTTAGASTITVAMHGDLLRAANGHDVIANNTLTISKGDWHTFTVTVDSSSDTAGTLITGYVDGKLVGEVFMKNAEMTQVIWNVGHTTRNGNASDNKGHWYMDNFKIELGNTVPAEWNAAADSTVLYEEDFNLAGKTAVSGNTTINYGGTLYSTVDLGGGNKAIKIDTDTLADDNDNTTGVVGNLDKNFIAKLPDGITHKAYKSVVLEASYFLEPYSRQQIESQLRYVTADYSTTFGGTPAATESTAPQWIQLYTIKHEENYAYFSNFGSAATKALEKTTYYNVTCPTGRWFTVSTVIDLETGAMSFYVDGVLAATAYMYASSGVTGFLTNIDLRAGTNGFIVAKVNSLRGVDYNGDGKIDGKDAQSGWTSAWPKGYSGFCLVDDISVYTGTAPKNAANGISVDFEDAAFANGNKATSAGQIQQGENTMPSGSNKLQQPAPSLAVYEQIEGNWAVKFDMKGVTAETTLTTPFIAMNSRAHDITVQSDGSWTPVGSGEVTWDMIEGDTAVLTKSTSDKPIYYYWDGGDTVHMYNSGSGVTVTEDNVGTLKYSAYVLNEKLNYNAMIRAMCAGSDSNIDKNFYLNTPALTAAGTYVLSADYYIPENAGGVAQGQMYTNWVDLYRFDLTNKTFNSANSSTAVADIRVNEWNNVTMVVTIADGKDVVFDVYFNGVYTHTVTKSGYKTIPTNDWILFKATKPTTTGVASQHAGNVYVDNVQFNVVPYVATDFVTLNANTIQVTTNGDVVTNVTKTSTKLYAPNGYDVLSATEFDGMINTVAAAQMRLKADLINSGLRFATEVDEALLDELFAMKENGLIKDVRFGTLIAPKDGYETLDFATLEPGVTVLDVEADYGYYWWNVDNRSDTTHFAGSIINIWYESATENNYNRQFSGRGYVEITLNNGTVYYVYSDYTHTVSVAEQAQKTIDSGLVTDAEQLAILQQYADLYVAQ